MIPKRPGRRSGRAASPPTAPSPTMTTPVFLRAVAMAASLHAEGCVCIRGLAYGLGPRGHALLVGGGHQSHAGIADQIPAYQVGFAAIIWVPALALAGVRPHD